MQQRTGTFGFVRSSAQVFLLFSSKSEDTKLSTEARSSWAVSPSRLDVARMRRPLPDLSEARGHDACKTRGSPASPGQRDGFHGILVDFGLLVVSPPPPQITSGLVVAREVWPLERLCATPGLVLLRSYQDSSAQRGDSPRDDVLRDDDLDYRHTFVMSTSMIGIGARSEEGSHDAPDRGGQASGAAPLRRNSGLLWL